MLAAAAGEPPLPAPAAKRVNLVEVPPSPASPPVRLTRREGDVSVPPKATHWRIERVDGQFGRERLEHGTIGEGTETTACMEWPIELFTMSTIREWWGPGTYQVSWRDLSDETQTGKLAGRSGIFKLPPLNPPPALVPPSDAPAAPARPGPAPTPAPIAALDAALSIMDKIDKRVHADSADRVQRVLSESEERIERLRIESELAIKRDREFMLVVRDMQAKAPTLTEERIVQILDERERLRRADEIIAAAEEESEEEEEEEEPEDDEPTPSAVSATLAAVAGDAPPSAPQRPPWVDAGLGITEIAEKAIPVLGSLFESVLVPAASKLIAAYRGGTSHAK